MLADAEGQLKGGNFAQVEQSCGTVMALADGWQPPQSLAMGTAPAAAYDASCPLARRALRLRMLSRLRLAPEAALRDAMELKDGLGHVAEAVARHLLGQTVPRLRQSE